MNRFHRGCAVMGALGELEPGDTLYLPEGVYYENVYCSVAGIMHLHVGKRPLP